MVTRPRRINPASEAKAREWEQAAGVLAYWFGTNFVEASAPEGRHVREVIVPSLRRRAGIIRRNAKK